MTEETKQAVQNLYTAFSNYRLNSNMEASPVYDEKEVAKWNQTVSSKPLTELTGEELHFFVFKVCYTWGDVSDYKHFLPRVFELIAEYREGEIEAWIAIEKLNYCNWKDWKKPEYEAVLNYLNSLWFQLINEEDVDALWNFEELFTSIAKVHPSYNQILKEWEESQGYVSMLRFCEFVEGTATELKRRGQVKQLKDEPELSDEFVHWAKGSMQQKLEKVFNSSEDEEMLEKLVQTVEILSNTKITSGNKV
jgi:hypothetical protein